jgi:hypothetical protein
MTGMVKEEVLTRQMELGWFIENGCIVFDFLLLDRNELLAEPAPFVYRNVHGKPERIQLPAGSLAYTICQVPVVLQSSEEPCIKVHYTGSSVQPIDGYVLDSGNSRHIFQRDGVVHHLVVSLKNKSS